MGCLGTDLDAADHTAACDVQAAAGANIPSAGFYDTHRAGQFLFTAVIQRVQRVRVRVGNDRRHIGKDRFVGLSFDLCQLLGGQNPVKVDGHAVPAQVKAHVIAAVQFVRDARKDVFACVALHVSEPVFPVEFTMYGLSDGQFCLAYMNDFVPGQAGVGHTNA